MISTICRGVAVVKMIGAVDELTSAVRRRRGDDFLRVFMKKLGLGAADDGEQRAADPFRVRTAIVVDRLCRTCPGGYARVKIPGVAPTPMDNSSSPLPSATMASAFSMISRKPGCREIRSE